jgi:hypothetical protein
MRTYRHAARMNAWPHLTLEVDRVGCAKLEGAHVYRHMLDAFRICAHLHRVLEHTLNDRCAPAHTHVHSSLGFIVRYPFSSTSVIVPPGRRVPSCAIQLNTTKS